MKKIITLFAAFALVFGLASCAVSETEVKSLHVDIDAFLSQMDSAEFTLQPDERIIAENGSVNLADVKDYRENAADDTAAVEAAVSFAEQISAGGTVYFSEGTYEVGNVTIPKNVGFAVSPTAVIKVKAGCVFKVDSDDIYISKRPTLTGEGDYDFTGGVNYCYPEWFGPGSKGFQKAVRAAETVYLTRTNYTLDETVVLPQGRNIDIIGISSHGTVITAEVSEGDPPCVFSYVYSEGEPTSVSFNFMHFLESGGTTIVFLHYEGDPVSKAGNVKFHSIRIESGKTLAEVTNATGCDFSEIYSMRGGLIADFGGGVNESKFTRVLCSGNKTGLITADGLDAEGNRSSGLYFYNSSSVTAGGIDFEIKNYDNVDFIQSSGDLGLGSDNPASLYMENVEHFRVIRSWWASNMGISVEPAAGAVPQKRVGIWLINCCDGLISGSTITNHLEGVKITGGSSEKRIVIEGNEFRGNGYSEISLDGAVGVDILGNTFESPIYYYSITKSPLMPDGIYTVWVKSRNSDCAVRNNFFLNAYLRDDDVMNKSYPGLTVEDNLFNC